MKIQYFDNNATNIPTYSINKVHNFDNTTTTIPIYSIINEYFQKGEIRIYLLVEELKD